MKVEEVVFLLSTLVVVVAYWKRDLAWPYLVVLVGSLGFNPYFWELKDSVISDFPFLLFFYLTALLAAHAPREGSRWPVWAVATGAMLYLCIGTRTVGITLVAGLLLYEAVKYRKLTRFAATAMFVCFSLLLVQFRIFGTGEQSYADQIHPTLTSLWTNGRELLRAFVTLWGRPWGGNASAVLFAITTVLAAIGAYKQKQKGLTTVVAFLCFYLPALLIPGPQGAGCGSNRSFLRKRNCSRDFRPLSEHGSRGVLVRRIHRSAGFALRPLVSSAGEFTFPNRVFRSRARAVGNTSAPPGFG